VEVLDAVAGASLGAQAGGAVPHAGRVGERDGQGP
jgi:hypothetical protein